MKNMCHITKLIWMRVAAVVGAMTLVSSVQAAVPVVIKPVSATASSIYSWPYGHYSDTHSIDGSGLVNPASVTTGSPVPGTWTAVNGDAWYSFTTPAPADPHFGDQGPGGLTYLYNIGGASWATESGGSGNGTPGNASFNTSIVYDLGSTFSLTGLHLWNFADSGELFVGVHTMEAWVSTTTSSWNPSDQTGWTRVLDETSVFSEGIANVTYVSDGVQNVATPTEVGDTKTFGETSARYVAFTKFTNWGNFQSPNTGSDSHVGIEEVRFIAVPEPSSVALLGLGGLMVMRRLRSSRA